MGTHEVLEGVAIIAVESIIGTEPHEARPVLVHVQYHTATKPLVHGDVYEAQGLTGLGRHPHGQQQDEQTAQPEQSVV